VHQIDMASNAIVRTWESIAAVARNLNIPIHEVNAVLQNKTDSAGGFKWEYALAGTGTYCKDCVFLCGAALARFVLSARIRNDGALQIGRVRVVVVGVAVMLFSAHQMAGAEGVFHAPIAA
jgi:hypothetical protein